MDITNLNTHSAVYVTVAELAEYWEVTRQLVYKHIQSGSLPAICLGPRCFRVRTKDALEFERLLSSKWTNGATPKSSPRAPSIQLIRQKTRPAQRGHDVASAVQTTEVDDGTGH
jgi:excisionase family DNA binding protein